MRASYGVYILNKPYRILGVHYHFILDCITKAPYCNVQILINFNANKDK